MKKIAICLLLVCVCVAGCAWLKQAGRTIKDVAETLCILTASEQDEAKLGGMDPEAWCEVEENLSPFLDLVLSAQEQAAGKAGFALPDDDPGE